MKVQFVCPVAIPLVNYTFAIPKISESKVKVQYPVTVASISRGGLVEVRFYSTVSVPNITNQTKEFNVGRQLSKSVPTFEPDQLITKEVLSVQIETKYTTKNVDWQCVGFTNKSIQLQLNFTDPMEISQDHQDRLILKFLQADLFVLSDQSEYLFQNGSTRTLIFNIPPQLPSNTTAEFFASVSASVQQVGVTVMVITLIIQIVAKKVITSMWLYYCALQIVILLVLRSNMYPPASVDIVINSVSGIINLSSLDK